ncbi:MAG: hypothetical protein HYZ17_09745 [Betaproteobacteria bacterium]|nr:hypothetical protein [Betaproteobacteria bacterium]
MLKRILAAALPLCLAAPLALAGADVQGKATVEVATPNTLIAETGQTVRDQRRLPGQVLRCWQEGRLVYEGGGFRGTSDKNGAAISVQRSGDNPAVTVLDLKQGMCILSSN